MPPITIADGAKSPKTPGWFTDAQWQALERVKQTEPKLKLGAARPEFMNRAMLADGSIVDDLEPVRAAARGQAANEVGNITEFEAHVAQNRFLFIADANGVPHTYFQCAVPGNPDVELAD